MKYICTFCLCMMFISCTTETTNTVGHHINNIYDKVETLIIKVNENDTLKQKYKNVVSKCDSIYSNIEQNADSIITNSKALLNEIKRNNKELLDQFNKLNN